ncbi:inactive pancreatic lipase-related protein 1-like [Physella acuta]|uniref:inactive pancreatic lipase-related protein 1-like n=1 Tax=Physella acuta TaxID=109671 RepID=UPI0027DE40D4|nr:inactive pancreatic lipase-related protein 1-like [Physella acuta]
MKDELLKQGDYNVILVDWSGGNKPPYTQATANTRVVGAQIAQLINQISAIFSTPAKNFHVIGHSLGAHISGYAGERVPGLGRITGLDPAGPYFENTPAIVRLDPTDALFVDVIHTDAGTLLTFNLGIMQAVGHVDFYPNGGHNQPGCIQSPITSIDQWGLIDGANEFVICNHMRAIRLFTESINSSCRFKSYPCASELNFVRFEAEYYQGKHYRDLKLNITRRFEAEYYQGKHYRDLKLNITRETLHQGALNVMSRGADGTLDSGNTRAYRDSGNTRAYRDSGNTLAYRDSGNTRAYRDSGNTRAYRDSGNTLAYRDSGNTRAYRDSGNTRAYRDSGNTQAYRYSFNLTIRMMHTGIATSVYRYSGTDTS